MQLTVDLDNPEVQSAYLKNCTEKFIMFIRNIFFHQRQDKCVKNFDETTEEMQSLGRLTRKFQDNI